MCKWAAQHALIHLLLATRLGRCVIRFWESQNFPSRCRACNTHSWLAGWCRCVCQTLLLALEPCDLGVVPWDGPYFWEDTHCAECFDNLAMNVVSMLADWRAGWALARRLAGLRLGGWLSWAGLQLGAWLSWAGLRLGVWLSWAGLQLGGWLSWAGLRLGAWLSWAGLRLRGWLGWAGI